MNFEMPNVVRRASLSFWKDWGHESSGAKKGDMESCNVEV